MTGDAIAGLLTRLGFTDVVTVPDSTIGPWDAAIEAANLRIVRVCREGEAWGVAMGLHLGGRRPLVLIQCTGFFESGDALRNVLQDWRLPIVSIIGYRSFLNQDTLPGDTCLVFTEPVLDAWKLDYLLVTSAAQLDSAALHLQRCREAGRPGVVLVAEGKA
ncbi:MAG: thiamine pyrophosphate-binding protein [Gemmatimonadaceae bacterium]